MIPLGRPLVIGALAALLVSCSDLPPVFEDVGSNPHPPEVEILGVAVQPPGDPLPEPNFLPPGTVITIRPFDASSNTFALLVRYRDAGGDIDAFYYRDKGVGSGATGTAVDAVRLRAAGGAPGPGAGRATEDDGYGPEGVAWLTQTIEPSVQGVHVLDLWAADLKEGRSEKVSFAINVQLF